MLRYSVMAILVLLPAISHAGIADLNLPAGHWYEVPNSSLSSVQPSPWPPELGRAAGAIDAWNGAAFDPMRHRLVVFGGGHYDGGDNSIYTFDLTDFAWHTPYVTKNAEDGYYYADRGRHPELNLPNSIEPYPDGSAIVRHTYDGLAYVQSMDSLLMFGTGTHWRSGGNIYESSLHMYDFRSDTWSTRKNFPNAYAIKSYQDASSIDPATGDVWATACGARLWQYNPVLETWTDHGSFGDCGVVLEIDQENRYLVAWKNSTSQVWALDLATGTKSPKTVANIVPGPSHNGPGFVYDPVLRKLVAWNGGTSLWALDTATAGTSEDPWRWTEYPATDGTSAGELGLRAQPNGTFGRFNYDPMFNVYVVVNAYDQNVWLRRLKNGIGVPILEPGVDHSVFQESQEFSGNQTAEDPANTVINTSTEEKYPVFVEDSKIEDTADPIAFAPIVNDASIPYVNQQMMFVAKPVVAGLAVKEISGVTIRDYPLTFGHVFRKGDVPSGKSIAVQLSDGVQLPTQFECKRTWDDESCKHGVVSAVIRNVDAGSSTPLELVINDTGHAGEGMTKAELLATDLESSIRLANMSGGATTGGYSGSRNVSLREAIAAGTYSYWLQGSVVTEILVRQKIPDAGGRDQLNGYWEARIYPGTDQGDGRPYMRIATSVENVEANLRANVTYDVSITYGATTPVEMHSQLALTHYSDTRWRKVFWLGTAPPEIEIRYDVNYWISTGLIPSYDTSLTVSEQTLSKDCTPGPEQGSVGYSCWGTKNRDINGNGFLNKYFPATGGRPEIGIFPKWTALYLLSMDNRMREITLVHSDLSGGIPIHYREPGTGQVAIGSDYPRQSLSGAFPSIGTVGGSGWAPDLAHQGSLNYVPYLITGERWHLDELYYWAAWNLWQQNQAYPGVARDGQIRGEAWGVRTVGQAGMISPDADIEEKTYFQDRINYAAQWWLDQVRVNGIQHWHPKMALGSWGYDAFAGTGRHTKWNPDVTARVKWIVSWWMEDFHTVVQKHLVDLGYTSVKAVLDSYAPFTVNRFRNHDGWNRYWAVEYQAPALIYVRNLTPAYVSLSDAVFSTSSSALTSATADFVANGFEVGDYIIVSGSQFNDTSTTGTSNTFRIEGVSAKVLTLGGKVVTDESPATITIELTLDRDAQSVQSWAELASFFSHLEKSEFYSGNDYPYSYRYQGLAALSQVAAYPNGYAAWQWAANKDGDGIDDGVDTYGQSLLAADPTWALVPRRPSRPRWNSSMGPSLFQR